MTAVAENTDTDFSFVQVDEHVSKSSFAHRLEVTLDAFAAASKIPLLEGPSGFGKTAAIRKYAKDKGRHLITFNVANRPSEDLVGHPRAVELTDQETGETYVVTKYTMTDWFHQIVTKYPNAIILFDEFKNANPENQAGLLNFLQDREIDGVELPSETTVIALCNPTDISANGWDLSAPAANRMCHIQWNFPATEMIDLIQANFYEPMSQREAQIRADISAFLNQNTSMLHLMPTKREEVAYGWPSPRSWDNAAKVIAQLPEDADDIYIEILDGYVGRAASRTFYNWRNDKSIPDVRSILIDGEEYPWNDPMATNRESILRFLYSALGLIRMENQYWQNLVDFLVECAEQGYSAQASSIVHQVLSKSVRPESATKMPLNLIKAFSEIFARIESRS